MQWNPPRSLYVSWLLCRCALRFFPQQWMSDSYNGPLQSFGNAPARNEILTWGKTHVAIGFVDLGGLAAACEMLTSRDDDLKAALAGADSVTAGSSSSSGSGSCSSKPSAAAEGVAGRQPLQWVGYEMSPYCVAKALVVLQMVEQGAALDNILQASKWLHSVQHCFYQCKTSSIALSHQADGDEHVSCYWRVCIVLQAGNTTVSACKLGYD